MSCTNVKIYAQKAKDVKIYLFKNVIQFLPNLQRLNKITKSVKSIKSENYLKSNKIINKTVIKINDKKFTVYYLKQHS